MRTLLTLASLAPAYAGLAEAQAPAAPPVQREARWEARSSPPTPGQDAIIVTAARLPGATEAGVSAVSVLTEEDLEDRQTVFLADALATLPGVFTAQNGAFGGQATVRIRGAQAGQTLILIDGAPVSDMTSPGGGFNAGLLEAAGIARVEVLRGPQSSLWGSDAIGGVVNILTRRPADGLSARGFAEAGSFGTVRSGASIAYGGERVDLRLGLSGTATDGISKADEADGNTEADGYAAVLSEGRVGVGLAPGLRLEGFARRSHAQTQFDRFGLRTGVEDGDEEDDVLETLVGGAVRASQWGGRLRHTVSAARARLDREVFSGGAFSFGAQGARETVRYQGDLAPRQGVVLAVGGERETVSVEGGEGARIDAVFALAEIEVFEGFAASVGVRRDDHSRFGDVATGRLGARWRVAPWLGVRASWGEGFKAPTVFQLTSSFGPFPPNGALRPETGEGYDGAIILTGLGGAAELEIGGFKLSIEDQIDFDFATLRYENIGLVETSGVELAAQWAPSRALTLGLAATAIDAANGVTGARLIRIPRFGGVFTARWQASPALSLSAQLRHNGEERDVPRAANPSGRVEGWTRLDLAARYALSPRLEVYARLENAADEAYQDVYGYGAPGRSAFAGVRVRIE